MTQDIRFDSNVMHRLSRNSGGSPAAFANMQRRDQQSKVAIGKVGFDGGAFGNTMSNQFDSGSHSGDKGIYERSLMTFKNPELRGYFANGVDTTRLGAGIETVLMNQHNRSVGRFVNNGKRQLPISRVRGSNFIV